MDSPAPPSDQVRHTQVCGGEIPVFEHLEHREQRPFKGVKTRPCKGIKKVSQSVSLVLSKLRIRYKGDHKCRLAANTGLTLLPLT